MGHEKGKLETGFNYKACQPSVKAAAYVNDRFEAFVMKYTTYHKEVKKEDPTEEEFCDLPVTSTCRKCFAGTNVALKDAGVEFSTYQSLSKVRLTGNRKQLRLSLFVSSFTIALVNPR